MKSPRTIIIALGVFALSSLVALSAAPKEKNSHEPSTPRASIRPKGKPNATERLALAKVDFLIALKTALTAVPGKVVYGELEVEDGNLEYDFQIITADKKVMDVAIDAGDGKILSAEEGDDE